MDNPNVEKYNDSSSDSEEQDFFVEYVSINPLEGMIYDEQQYVEMED